MRAFGKDMIMFECIDIDLDKCYCPVYLGPKQLPAALIKII